MIKVMADGKLVDVKFLNDLKVIVENDDGQDIHFTFTHEGIVTDFVQGGEVTGGNSMTFAEMLDENEDNYND